MTKQELKAITGQAFAHSAYISDGDDSGVTGKYAFATYNGAGVWDVWLRNEDDLAKGLGARKLNNIIDAISSLKNTRTGPLRRLDGEAVYERVDTETLLRIAPLLGIRKRRQASGKPFTAKEAA